MALEKLQTDAIHFGELIRETLQSTNYSIRFLASELGYTDVHLYRIFHKEDVNTEILRKVCRLTQIELSALLLRPQLDIHVNSGSITYSDDHASSDRGNLIQQVGVLNQEAGQFQASIDLLNVKIISLEKELEMKEEIIRMKDEIITLYKVNSK